MQQEKEGVAREGTPAQKQPITIKSNTMVLREEGRTVLPISRVQRIIKADKVRFTFR